MHANEKMRLRIIRIQMLMRTNTKTHTSYFVNSIIDINCNIHMGFLAKIKINIYTTTNVTTNIESDTNTLKLILT